MAGPLRHFLQDEVLDRLHCRQLLQVQLHIALRVVARRRTLRRNEFREIALRALPHRPGLEDYAALRRGKIFERGRHVRIAEHWHFTCTVKQVGHRCTPFGRSLGHINCASHGRRPRRQRYCRVATPRSRTDARGTRAIGLCDSVHERNIRLYSPFAHLGCRGFFFARSESYTKAYGRSRSNSVFTTR
jgi:hypothetical protein